MYPLGMSDPTGDLCRSSTSGFVDLGYFGLQIGVAVSSGNGLFVSSGIESIFRSRSLIKSVMVPSMTSPAVSAVLLDRREISGMSDLFLTYFFEDDFFEIENALL